METKRSFAVQLQILTKRLVLRFMRRPLAELPNIFISAFFLFVYDGALGGVFGGSAEGTPLDFANGNFERTLNGEIKRVQWLRISDERYLKEVTSEWETFLNKARYKKIPIEDDDGQDHYLFIRGSRTRFDEAHLLFREDSSTILLTFYGDFTLTKTLDED